MEDAWNVRAFPAICGKEEVNCVIIHVGLREEVRVDCLANGGRAIWDKSCQIRFAGMEHGCPELVK